ncbi:hypothetical protein RB598_001783 [Gaeumannomyces tritici]
MIIARIQHLVAICILLGPVAVLAQNRTGNGTENGGQTCPQGLPGFTLKGEDCKVICHAARWLDIVLFFVGNYVVHAATVPGRPGQSTISSLVALLTALLLPGGGVRHGIEVIMTLAIFQPTPLRTAARAGAICAVVRTRFSNPDEDETELNLTPSAEEREQTRLMRGARHVSAVIIYGRNLLTWIYVVIGGAFIFISTMLISTSFPLRARFGSNKRHQIIGILTRALQIPLKLLRFIHPMASVQGNSPVIIILGSLWRNVSLMFRSLSSPTRLSTTKVHGFYELPDGYELVVVQANATFDQDPVEPDGEQWNRGLVWEKMKRALRSQRTTVISCSHNYIKSGISLAQLLFSLWTLYRTKLDQIDQFGYAAFGLTVAPYAWMSIINGLGNLFCPQYDCLYIAESQGLRDFAEWRDDAARTAEERERFRVEGVVGTLDKKTDDYLQAYHRERLRLRTLLHFQRNADLTGWEDLMLIVQYHIAREVGSVVSPEEEIPRLETKHLWRQIKAQILSTLLSFLAAGVPLAIVGAMSSFRPGRSTGEERGWTMAWLALGVLGQQLNAPAVLIEGRPIVNKAREATRYHRRLLYLLVVLVTGVPCIGGMVMVVRMIQKFGVCAWLGGN